MSPYRIGLAEETNKKATELAKPLDPKDIDRFIKITQESDLTDLLNEAEKQNLSLTLQTLPFLIDSLINQSKELKENEEILYDIMGPDLRTQIMTCTAMLVTIPLMTYTIGLCQVGHQTNYQKPQNHQAKDAGPPAGINNNNYPVSFIYNPLTPSKPKTKPKLVANIRQSNLFHPQESRDPFQPPKKYRLSKENSNCHFKGRTHRYIRR